MSIYIEEELTGFVHAFLYGSFLVLLYDLLILWRRVSRHSYWMIGCEDLTYWICSGFLLFLFFLKDYDGEIRWYLLVGVLLAVSFSRIILRVCEILTIPLQKSFFFAKRLKFHLIRCRILMCIRKMVLRLILRLRTRMDRGADHGKKKDRKEEKKYKS